MSRIKALSLKIILLIIKFSQIIDILWLNKPKTRSKNFWTFSRFIFSKQSNL